MSETKIEMRAISLWQPWASLIAIGAKKIETRSWETSYRGPIAIHAAKRLVKSEMTWLSCLSPFESALSPINPNHESLYKVLPFGAILAVADLVDCRPTESFTNGELDVPHLWNEKKTDYNYWTERRFGDYSMGRYGWVLENIRPLPEPIPQRGAQGFFRVQIDLKGGAI